MVNLLLLALPLLGGPIQEPNLQTKVTLKLNATRAKPALEELSKAAGFPLMSAQVLDNEVLVINVADAPIGELMKRIANVTASQWEREGTGYRLVRSEIKMREEELAERNAEIAEIRKTIAKLTKGNSKPLTRAAADALVKKGQQLSEKMQRDSEDPNMSAWQEYEKFRSDSPAAKLAIQLLASADPAQIAAIPPNERRVFATNPTRMQIPLASTASAALATYIREQAIMDQAAEAAGVKERDEEEGSHGFFGELFPVSNSKVRPVKVLLVINRWSYSSSLSAEVRIMGEDGSMVGSASQQLSDHDDNEAEYRKAIAKTSDDKPLQLGPVSTLLMTYVKSMFTGMGDSHGMAPKTPEPLPDALRDFLLNPERTDPLQIVSGDGTLELGTADSPNVIACLPDNMGSGGFGMGGFEQISQRQFETFLKLADIVTIARTPGWTEVRPSRPSSARKMRVNREVLGKFVRAINKKGSLRLDDLASFALLSPQSENGEVAMMYTTLLTGDYSMMARQGNWEMLRFYGSLSLPQRQSMIDGRPLSVANLSPLQRDILTKMVYYKTNSFGYGGWGDEESHDAEESTSEAESEAAPPDEAVADQSEFGPAMEETTESLPNGIPGNGYITLKAKQEQVLRAGAGFMYEPGGTSAESIAGYLAMKERPDLFPGDEYTMDLKQLRIGQNISYNFVFALAPKVQMRQSLSDSFFDDKTSYTLETLPAAIRKQIDKALIDYREAYKDMKKEDMGRDFRHGGNRPPPPPPRRA